MIEHAEDESFIVMEYIEGRELGEIVQTEGRASLLPTETIIDYGAQIVSGLQAAHEKGVVHRDIKSANIMVTEKGQVKIMDFGLAKVAGSDVRLTKEHTTLGTVAYMSPEQARGEEIDHRSDIWAFGVVLYEMLTGKLPFPGEYEQAILYSIINETYEPLSEHCEDVPEELETAVNKALAKDKEERFQSMDDVLAILQGDVLQSSPQSKFTTRNAQAKKRRFALTAAALAVLFIAFLGYFFVGDNATSAERVPIAVVDFINESDEKALDGLSGMLITSLEQSRRLSVMTRSRMFDVMRQMGKMDVSAIDEQLGRDICRKANVGAMAVATIRKFDQLYTIDLNVIDPINDEFLFSAREQGEGQSNIPGMLDALAAQMRSGLRERKSEIEANNTNIAKVTTPNLEAYHHYFKGQELIDKYDIVGAKSEFKKAVALDSTFASAWFQLAYASNYSLGEEIIAYEPLEKAFSYFDHLPEKHQYLVKALKMQLDNGYGICTPILMEADSLYPNDYEILHNIGWDYLSSKKFSLAEKYTKKLYAQDSTKLRTLYELSFVYSAQKKHKEARRIIERGFEFYPDHYWLVATLIDVLIRQKKSAEVEQLLKKYQNSDSTNAMMFWTIGYGYEWLNRFEEANSAFQIGLRHVDNADSVWFLKSLGYNRARAGQMAKAEKWLRVGFEQYPSNNIILQALINVFSAQNKNAEAEQILNDNLQGNPENLKALELLGSTLSNAKKFKEAEELFERALRSYPDRLNFRSAYAWALYNQRTKQKYSEAENLFRQVLQTNPNEISSVNGLAWCLIYQRKFAAAKELFQRVVDSFPGFTGAFNGLARIAIVEKDFELAKEVAEKYFLGFNSSHSSTQLGVIAFLEGDETEAEELFKAAIAIDSTDALPYLMHGYLKAKQGDFASAFEYANKSLMTENPNIFFNKHATYNFLAWLKVTTEEDVDGGIQLIEEARSLEFPTGRLTDPVVCPFLAIPEHTLGLAYMHKGEYEKAASYFEQALEMFPDRQNIRDDFDRARSALYGDENN